MARSIAAREKDAQALELRRRGLTYRQIAERMKWANQKSAWEAVQHALKDAIAEPAAEVKRIELDRLDEYMRHALRVLAAPHYAISQKGEVVFLLDAASGAQKPVMDDAPVLAAIDRLLKISERRARLLGLDAPRRIEVRGIDAIDASLLDLAAQVGSLEPGPAPGVPREA
jgi:hypothetical protein